jgi:ribose transport system substrate-binding protein
MNLGRRILLVLGMLACVAVLAACGEDGEVASEGDAPPSKAATTSPSEGSGASVEPLDLAIEPKTIGLYCAVCQGETVRRTAMGAKRAFELIGWKVNLVDGEGNPEKQQQVMTALVNAKVDAIVGAFLEPGPIASALEAAKKAEIPVVSVGFPSTPSDLVAAVYPGEDESVSQLLVERMAEDLPENAKVAEVDLPQYHGVQTRKNVWRASAKENGFDIVATHAIGDLSRQVVESEKAGLDIINSNSELTAFWSCCDFSGQPLVRAVEASGKDIPVFSYYALPSVIRYIREGKIVVVEPDNLKSGFMALEQLVDFFENGTPIDAEKAMSESPPEATIVDETNAPADGEEIYPFEELWQPFAERLNEKYGS